MRPPRRPRGRPARPGSRAASSSVSEEYTRFRYTCVFFEKCGKTVFLFTLQRTRKKRRNH
jgi:hypothetical protein